MKNQITKDCTTWRSYSGFRRTLDKL